MENVRKIDVSDLRVGMYVVDTGLSWIDYPLLYSEEGTIADASQLETIVEQGYKHVFIDPERGPAGPVEESPSPGDMAAPGELPDEPAPDKVPIEEEMAVARKLYSDSLRFAHEFLEDVKNGTRIDIKQSERFVDEMIDSVMRNADALVSLSKLRAFDEYTFTHSINVAVLSLAFGKHLKLNREAMQVLGSSALFHDVGKALIPEEILNKPGRLTDEEFAVIKSHPAKGHEIMKKQVGIDKRILRGIAEHHEKINGNGYPQRLSGDKIGLMGKLISLADVYDALTSERVYKKGMLPHKALRIIYELRDQDFVARLVDSFIKCLGIYPVGSFVLLSTGEYAIVYESNPQAPLFPNVLVVMDQKQRMATPVKRILATPENIMAAEEQGTGVSILKTLDPGKYNLSPFTYLS